MINDYTLLEGIGAPDDTRKDLALWVKALGKGVRDFAVSEMRRAQLERVLSEGGKESERLSQLLANFHKQVDSLKLLRRTSTARLPAKDKRAIAREIASIEKLLASTTFEDALVFLGYDEPTQWFWSSSEAVGSIVWMHSWFQSILHLDRLRKLVVKAPHKFAYSTL